MQKDQELFYRGKIHHRISILEKNSWKKIQFQAIILMYSALAEPAVEGGGACIRILLIAYAVYALL